MGELLQFHRYTIEGFKDGDSKHMKQCAEVCMDKFRKEIVKHGYEVVGETETLYWEGQRRLADKMIDITITAMLRPLRPKPRKIKPKFTAVEMADRKNQMNLLPTPEPA